MNSPDAGALAAKLRAEFTMYNSLAAVFGLFALFTGYRGGQGAVCAGLGTLAFLMAARGRETQKTMKDCVENFHKAAIEPAKPRR